MVKMNLIHLSINNVTFKNTNQAKMVWARSMKFHVFLSFGHLMV